MSHIGRTDPIDLPVRASAPHQRLIVAVLLAALVLAAALLLFVSVDGSSPAGMLLTASAPSAVSAPGLA